VTRARGWRPLAIETADLPKSLKAHAYNLIKAAVLRGDIEVGVVISQDQLSQWLGISRTPVREALLELQNEGLVRVLRGRGVEIERLTPEDAQEIIEIRKGLEAHAAHLVALKPASALIEQLERELSIMRILAAQNQRHKFLESDRTFHRLIVGATGNRRMQGMAEALRDQFMRVGVQALEQSTNMIDVIAEHLSIVTAIGQNNPAGARDAMLNHLEHTAGRFLHTMKKEPV